MPNTLKAEARQTKTKSDTKTARKQGKIPGVVYGKQLPSTAIMVDEKELLALLKESAHAIVDLEMPDHGHQPVMVSAIQREKVNRRLLHIDFHQIEMNEPVKTSVVLELKGQDEAEAEGGLLTTLLHEVEIRCLPKDIPASIVLDVSSLRVGDSILAGALQLPPGVSLKSDPETLLVTVLAPQKEELVIPVDEEEKREPVQAKTEAPSGA
ncbi:50S ribosomal protein L25 [Paenibacillus sp. y28]|uniref:50S ribosomal protein L25 n=1 Tax=Paenibacillus sp. y28 TaxID=3129110 RepID=UPI003016E910